MDVKAFQHVSPSTLRVLRVMVSDPAAVYGYALASACGVRRRNLYVILHRLVEKGWLISEWDSPNRSGPRRRLYGLSSGGRRAALELLSEHGIELLANSPLEPVSAVLSKP
ncbi:PadR family transcriptional regulator [Herbidospora mongoliensis]|uniref:PadR family transcriptional regulator n=1 Tax=Herbidospora mongoliensis TaxID=688067 RepID=UPI0008319F81|nr:helix-turn-helix transcriptional regulator [Herbidospora mongoliensis]